MEKITGLQAAALGLLAEAPMHPYEMFQLLLDRHDDFLLKIRSSSLYYAVDKLLEAGLVAEVGTDREGNRPERTTYSLTETGLRALQEHLADAVTEVVNEFPAFRRGIAELHGLSESRAVELLTTRLANLRTVRGRVAGYSLTDPAKRQFSLHFEYSLAILDAEIAWISSLIEDLSTRRIIWDVYADVHLAQPSTSQPH